MPRRKTTPPIESAPQPEVTESARQIVSALDAHDSERSESAIALASRLGYSGSLLPEALEDGITEAQVMINQGLFALGARLLLLKEVSHHGDFLACLERRGIEQSLARRTMNATLKFSNRAISHDLGKISKSKLFELAILDDDEVGALEEGQSVRGVSLDEVGRLTVSELRARLRSAEAEGAAKDRLIAEKNTRLDGMQKKLHEVQTPPQLIERVGPDLSLEGLLRETSEYHRVCVVQLDAQMRSCYTRLADYHEVQGGSSAEMMAAQLDQVQRVINELREEFRLPAHVEEGGVPEWQRWNEARDGDGDGDAADGDTTMDWIDSIEAS